MFYASMKLFDPDGVGPGKKRNSKAKQQGLLHAGCSNKVNVNNTVELINNWEILTPKPYCEQHFYY
jgi:hypothetical protein